MSIPNLDKMSQDDLLRFMFQAGGRPIEKAAELFEAYSDEYVTAAKVLAAYASHKAEIIRLREEGNEEQASLREAACEMIYQSLPEWAKFRDEEALNERGIQA